MLQHNRASIYIYIYAYITYAARLRCKRTQRNCGGRHDAGKRDLVAYSTARTSVFVAIHTLILYEHQTLNLQNDKCTSSNGYYSIVRSSGRRITTLTTCIQCANSYKPQSKHSMYTTSPSHKHNTHTSLIGDINHNFPICIYLP